MHPVLLKQYKVYQICSENACHNDDVQDFDVRWDQASLTASEKLTEMVLEGLYKVTIAGCCSASDSVGFVY